MIIQSLNDFREVINSNNISFIYFFASWCGPCKMLGPIYNKVASNSSFIMKKIDIDELEEVATEYGIMSIPTIICFKNGKEISRKNGFLDEPSLLLWIKSI